MGSDCVNRFFIFLSTLLMSSIVFTSVPDVVHSGKSNPGPQSCPKNNLHLSTPEECNRVCRKGEPPKICYWHWTLELYPVLGAACDLCTPKDLNAGNCSQCIQADGVERIALAVNRQLPGPDIRVCLGDKVIVDVLNLMDGLQVSIHWHGILQKGSQYFDGVPFVTQCPIMQGNTFRYQWHANNEGTHFWHSHAGMHKMDGIYGSLVVVVPRSDDSSSYHYDYDLSEHVMLVADWMHEFTGQHFPGLRKIVPFQLPVSFLVNGKGKFTDPKTGIQTNTSLEEFIVKPGRRYRFRFINACCSTCPIQVVFEKHTMAVIAVDGEPVEPVEIGSMISVAGERIDVVISADQPPGSYWIQIFALGDCAKTKIHQLAILRYAAKPDWTSSAPPTYDMSLPMGVVLAPLKSKCKKGPKDGICISELKNVHPVEKAVLQGTPDFKFYYEVGFHNWTPKELYQSNTYPHFGVPTGGHEVAAFVNNITFETPPSPLLSQRKDIPPEQICDKYRRPANCGNPCHCTQVIHIPLNAVVECIITDGIGIPSLTHPIHMHGYSFSVIGMGISPDKKIKRMKWYHARNFDRKHKLQRHLDRAPSKDTVAIPTSGYIVIRFRATNPGYWLMHCHFLFHQLVGMEAVLRVGEDEDLPPIPPNFPDCGNYLPKIEPNAYKPSY